MSPEADGVAAHRLRGAADGGGGERSWPRRGRRLLGGRVRRQVAGGDRGVDGHERLVGGRDHDRLSRARPGCRRTGRCGRRARSCRGCWPRRCSTGSRPAATVWATAALALAAAASRARRQCRAARNRRMTARLAGFLPKDRANARPYVQPAAAVAQGHVMSGSVNPADAKLWAQKWRWYGRAQRARGTARSCTTSSPGGAASPSGRCTATRCEMLREGRLELGEHVLFEPGVWLTARRHDPHRRRLASSTSA